MAVNLIAPHRAEAWKDVELQGDETPPGYGSGQRSAIFTSKDEKVKVYLYRREKDIGQLQARKTAESRLFICDLIIEGAVTITGKGGEETVVKAGEIITYNGADEGRWKADEPLLKLAISIEE